MATAEADTPRNERSPPGGSVYDGFISYSHAAAAFRGSWQGLTNVISRDGSRLFLMDQGGGAWEYDTATWQPGWQWQAQQSKPRGIAISLDDTKLAVSGGDGLIWIWQIDTEEEVFLDRIPAAADRVSDIMWIDDDRMGAALGLDSFRGEWQIIDLAADAVVE